MCDYPHLWGNHRSVNRVGLSTRKPGQDETAELVDGVMVS